ncbi:hypothetical protein NW766_004424 [Fusarium irregulare]|uniref:Uncharacterized protein n=1 Tax=Fusarium irregulare TaxID=2494466 RepID=A0A9W8PRM3_9HYPO|nr:hypothetical protein NW766_004424 [Fusarium irregulare]
MCAIYLIAICQEWLGNCYDNAKHYQVLGNLLESAVQNPSFDPSARPFMHTIFAVVVLESFTNPNVQLGPWFWQAFSLLSEGGRPLKSGDGTSFASLDIGTMGEISCFIRDPDKLNNRDLSKQSAQQLRRLENPAQLHKSEDSVFVFTQRMRRCSPWLVF